MVEEGDGVLRSLQRDGMNGELQAQTEEVGEDTAGVIP